MREADSKKERTKLNQLAFDGHLAAGKRLNIRTEGFARL